MTHSGDPLAWLDDDLASLEQSNLRRRLATRTGVQGPTINLDGRELLNFGANDYLGLAADPRLVAAANECAEREGWGAGASPLVTGHSAAHAQLERDLAEFEGTEAALLFTSGFAANAGTIAALAGRDDLIVADEKNHASLIDGCRLSRAHVEIYPHGDVDRLAELLQGKGLRSCARTESLTQNPLPLGRGQGEGSIDEQRSTLPQSLPATEGSSDPSTASSARGPFRRKLIVTDTLFSMDGDLAPLPAIVDLARRHGAMLMVDEAHATGVFGRQGRGVSEHFGVEEQIDVRVGTLSKALGSLGGFVAGRRSLIEWLLNRARPWVFSTALPGPVAAAGSAALNIVRTEPLRGAELLKRAAELRAQLTQQGWNVGRSASQIIPLVIGSAEATMQLAEKLRERGLLVPPIRPPSVPQGESLLRISLSYAHTSPMIARLCEALHIATAAQ